MEDQADTWFHQRLKELFRETECNVVDVLSGRVTVKESRAKDREVGKRLKALEQELKRKSWASETGNN